MPAIETLAVAAACLTAGALSSLATAWFALAAAKTGFARIQHGASALLLLALAMWWPLHLAPGTPGGFGDRGWSALGAAALAGLAGGAALAWRHGRRTHAGGLAAAAVAAAWAMFEAARPDGAPVPLLLPAGLALPATAALLLALMLPPASWLARGAVGLLAFVPTYFGAWCAARTGYASTAGGAEWGMLLALTGVGAIAVQAVARAGTRTAIPRGREIKASVDALTGLPLRGQFESRLAKAVHECHARGGVLAVMQINLDGFKSVNDRHGFRAGDRVLEKIGQRLRRIARSDDALARLGGNDFLMLVTGLSAPAAIDGIAKRVVEALAQPHRIEGGGELRTGCSVGVAIWPGTARATRLVGCAELAMRAAKRAGGARHCLYTPELDSAGPQADDLMQDLQRAITTNALELHFQPKIDARSAKVSAAEALLRWRHPTRGLIPPADFIPLAESSGLIVSLGDWVIEEACRQARAWRDAGLRMRVAINLSALQMQQGDIVQRIGQALERHRIHPSLLTCEITESAAMEDTQATQETFRQLGQIGVHVSIDDFGTGYSSLAYLRQLPAQELKIDRAFVTDLEHSADARAIVDAVVKLAHALGLKVVAEGVETPQQHRILVDLGCDELQGYLFARPMTARALLLWAINDKPQSKVFRGSLFGSTVDGSSQNTKRARDAGKRRSAAPLAEP